MASYPTTILIPAFNEADRISETVRTALALPEVVKVIVIDDGSTDDTAARAQASGACVIRMPRNAGKGAALNRGLAEARTPYLLLLDADLGSSAAEALRLLQPVWQNEADMTIATFPHTGHKGGFGLAVKLARWGIRKLSGQEMKAPLSGQRAMRKEVAEAAGGFEERFRVEVALTLDALRLGFSIQEVQTRMAHRLTGRTWKGFLHRGRQFADVLRVLIKRWKQR